jgi:hypothetical protein
MAVTQADAVHHAVAEEPVMGGRIVDLHRVWADSGIDAVQLGRDVTRLVATAWA